MYRTYYNESACQRLKPIQRTVAIVAEKWFTMKTNMGPVFSLRISGSPG